MTIFNNNIVVLNINISLVVFIVIKKRIIQFILLFLFHFTPLS